ncbi:MAG: protoheme IX farnesyltransferase [alpha proteobacterium HIMB59]|nr:MAG: protoheme IX farnesyltransferase [alpha proteobacterium HIMB59]
MSLNNKHNSNINSSGFSEPLGLLVNFLKQIYVLIKPGVISLVIFTALCAMLIAPSDKSLFLKAVSLLLIAMGASGSAILNMWNDRVIDSKMERTKFRPIPAGNISANTALAIGLIFSFFSVVLLFFFANIKASLLLAFTIIYYSVFYTMYLKHRTAQNIVIGGLAGALPPVIAWISVSNEMLIYPIILCLIIFLWTPPHSWALAIYRNQDYSKADVPMYPVKYGIKKTLMMMNIYTFAMIISVNLLFFTGLASWFFLITANILNGYFTLKLYKLNYSSNLKKDSIKLFGFSIVYLFSIFLFAVIDKYI